MKVFVFTDNRFIHDAFRPLFSGIADAEVDFFCSPSSEPMFREEVAEGTVKPASLKRDCARFLDYDLGFSCHSRQLFPAELVTAVRCLNVHPGLNPHNRGWYPQVFSILNGLPAGATIHVMDEAIDHGPIVCQNEVAIQPWDTSRDVYQRLLREEVALFEAWLPRLVKGDYEAVPPGEEGNYNGKADFAALCEIDPDEVGTFREFVDRLRALSHPPFSNAWMMMDGRKVHLRLELEAAGGDDGA